MTSASFQYAECAADERRKSYNVAGVLSCAALGAHKMEIQFADRRFVLAAATSAVRDRWLEGLLRVCAWLAPPLFATPPRLFAPTPPPPGTPSSPLRRPRSPPPGRCLPRPARCGSEGGAAASGGGAEAEEDALILQLLSPPARPATLQVQCETVVRVLRFEAEPDLQPAAGLEAQTPGSSPSQRLRYSPSFMRARSTQPATAAAPLSLPSPPPQLPAKSRPWRRRARYESTCLAFVPVAGAERLPPRQVVLMRNGVPLMRRR